MGDTDILFAALLIIPQGMYAKTRIAGRQDIPSGCERHQTDISIVRALSEHPAGH